MKISATRVIDRPVPVVWRFVATDHVRNHPRWDPNMALRQVTDGAVGVGTVIERRHTRLDVPIEGTMEIVEFTTERAMGAVIEDRTPAGRLEVHSRMVVEPTPDGRTTLTIDVELLGEHASMDSSMIEASLTRIKGLIESES